MNENLHNGYVISGIGLLNKHNPPQDSESSKLNEINISVDNGDVNYDCCYMNSSTGYVINNHNIIDYKNKRDIFYQHIKNKKWWITGWCRH